MKRPVFALALALVALSGCAHWSYDGNPSGGASAVEEQSPFPTYPKNVAG